MLLLMLHLQELLLSSRLLLNKIYKYIFYQVWNILSEVCRFPVTEPAHFFNNSMRHCFLSLTISVQTDPCVYRQELA